MAALAANSPARRARARPARVNLQVGRKRAKRLLAALRGGATSSSASSFDGACEADGCGGRSDNLDSITIASTASAAAATVIPPDLLGSAQCTKGRSKRVGKEKLQLFVLGPDGQRDGESEREPRRERGTGANFRRKRDRRSHLRGDVQYDSGPYGLKCMLHPAW